MNSLSQLISDLDLDEPLVLRRLKSAGLVSPLCVSASEVADADCDAAIKLVMTVLRGKDFESVTK